jgi:hypothetical protein
VSDSESAGDAQLLLRVWIERHDALLRGRLVTPTLPDRSTARGIDDLCELVRRGLQRLQDELL